jgi:2-amino-4-hydroxy-6-hydroxymethyldihydropteridine diphosphokinase
MLVIGIQTRETLIVQKTSYLSLGSNMGDRSANLQAAIGRLSGIGEIRAVSSFYDTEPVDFVDQPWFLNCVVAIETELMPRQFLARLQSIEREMGRRRTQFKGPRTIDLDILLFGNTIVDLPNLVIPHPALHERRFVLEALTEIAPEVRHPVFKKTARQMRDALPAGQAVKKAGF